MTLVRCPQKALSFPNRIILGRSGLEHLVDLAAPLLLLLRAESPHKTLPQPPGSCPTACPLPQVSQPPDFDSEVLFTKHSPYPCPRVLPPVHLQHPHCLPRACFQPLLLQSPLWAHRPGLWVEPSCESPQIAVCISSVVSSLPFQKQPCGLALHLSLL